MSPAACRPGSMTEETAMAEGRDRERVGRICAALEVECLEAVVCSSPENVLLASGYWPVVGDALAVVTRQGRVAVIAPEDEKELALAGWADDLLTFRPATLEAIRRIDEVVEEPLRTLALGPEFRRRTIGFDGGPACEPASYSGSFRYGVVLAELLARVFSASRLESAEGMIKRLRAEKTPREVARIRTACRVAEQAFRLGARSLRVGRKETEAAAPFRTPLSTIGTGFEGVLRGDGFAFCMSGPNSAKAGGAYARSAHRVLAAGDVALVHVNSYADGYWTDITRTYSLGPPSLARRALYDAVLAARDAALAAIRPGVRAADVDRAAREVLHARDFGGRFTHATGHGVGFAAIDPDARPRLHPASEDVLRAGMVFNVEPAIYIQGDCGVRHCDVVAVNDHGVEVLTPFQATIDDLIVE